MEVHKLFWLMGEQANINYDKIPSCGTFQGNISRLYLKEVTKICHGRRYFGWGSNQLHLLRASQTNYGWIQKTLNNVTDRKANFVTYFRKLHLQEPINH